MTPFEAGQVASLAGALILTIVIFGLVVFFVSRMKMDSRHPLDRHKEK